MSVASSSCPRCADPTNTALKHRATTPVPSLKQLERWNSECGCEATDGCWVEPDGKCEHGHSSWMLRMGLI